MTLRNNLFVGYLLVLALLVARLWEVIYWPLLTSEDSTHMLSFFFNTNDIVYVIRQLNGYLSLLPNIMAWAIVQLPLNWAPYVMNWVAILILSLAMFSFALPHFRFLIQQDSYRILVTVALCLFPLGKLSLAANVNNTQWNFLLLFILWLVAGPPRRLAWLLVYVLMMSLMAFSHPLTAGTVPLLLILIFVKRDPREKFIYGYFILLLGLYLTINMASVGTAQLVQATPQGLGMFVQRVAAELLLGAKARLWLSQNHYSILVATGALSSIMPIGIAVYRKLPLNIILIILGLLGTALAFTLVSGWRFEDYQEALGIVYLQRYYYVPRVLLLLAFAVSCLHGRDAMVFSLKKVPLFILFGTYFLLLNYYNGFLYESNPRVSQATLQVLEAAAQATQQARAGRSYQAVHTGGGMGEWNLHLDIDCHMHERRCFSEEQERLRKIGRIYMPGYCPEYLLAYLEPDGSRPLLSGLDPAWVVQATGDLDGDGVAETLVRNDNLLSFLEADNSGFFIAALDPTWTVEGIGDLDGDGVAEVLVRNDRILSFLEADNSATFIAELAPAWNVQGLGDLDGDGAAEVLLRNDNLLSFVKAGADAIFIAALARPWHVVGLADYDDDGLAEVLVRDKKTLSYLDVDGTAIAIDWLDPACAAEPE